MRKLICLPIILLFLFPNDFTFSQSPGSGLGGVSIFPGSQPPPKTEKQKAEENVKKAEEELAKARAELERLRTKIESNRENNRKLGESVEKDLKEAQAKKDVTRARVLSQLLDEIKRRIAADPSQDPGKLLDEALSATEKRLGRLPKDLKDKIKNDIYKRSGLDLRAKGTGRTTGHIANLEITNLGDEPITFSMPVMEIPSTGEYQGYIVDVTPPVTMAPGDTETMPLFGYCTDVFKAPVPTDIVMPPFEDWLVNTTIIEHLYDIVEIIKTFQSQQDHATPLSDHPDIETITITQHVLWLTDSPNGIYTFEDICIDITQQIETTTGRPISTFTPGEYYTFRDGLDDLIDMINEVGVTAGIPSFISTPVIPEKFRPDPFPTPSDTGPSYTVTATGTGRTTGHVADLTFTNPGKTPVTIQIGSGNGLFIPSSGHYQPYIVPSIPPVPLEPGETITIPGQGYCIDIHLPPVPSGGGMPDIADWYSVPPPTGIQSDPGVITFPTKVTFPTQLAHDILTNSQPLVWSSLGEDCIPAVNQTTSTIPGTSRPIPGTEDGLFSTTQKPDVIVPILLDAINRITITYDEMKKEQLITTPFSGNPEKEREAVIQQTFWRYTAGLEGKKYEKKNFQDNTIRQYEQNTGKDFESLPEPQKDKINDGADDFWDTFEAVGVEAKVLTVPPLVQAGEPITSPQDVWEDYNVDETKATSANDDPPAVIPMPDADVMVSADAAVPHCKCGKISFELYLGAAEGGYQISSEQNKKEIEVKDLERIIGDRTIINPEKKTRTDLQISDIEINCDCSLTGKCNHYPRNSQFEESDEGKFTITSSTHDVSTYKNQISVQNKEYGYNNGLKLKIHAWCKGDSCKETKDCFEEFTITFKQKQK